MIDQATAAAAPQRGTAWATRGSRSQTRWNRVAVSASEIARVRAGPPRRRVISVPNTSNAARLPAATNGASL